MRSVWEHFSPFPLDCQKWDTPLFLLPLSTWRDELYFLGRPEMLTGYSRQPQCIAWKCLRTWGRDRSRSLSRALPRPLLFTLACAFIFFQIFILCPVSQEVGSEKRGKDNFSVRRKIGYLSITSDFHLPSHWAIAFINFVPSLLKPVLNALGSHVRARRYVRPWTGRGKMGKGPTSNASYPHINFQICQEAVTIYNWSC